MQHLAIRTSTSLSTAPSTVMPKLDETAGRFVTQLTTALSRSFEQHNGRVVKLLGDGLFVTFPHETDAIAACVGILKRLKDTPVYPGGNGEPVQMQMGMQMAQMQGMAQMPMPQMQMQYAAYPPAYPKPPSAGGRDGGELGTPPQMMEPAGRREVRLDQYNGRMGEGHGKTA